MVGGRSKENLIAVARSANDRLAPEDVHAVRETFQVCSAVVCQLEISLETVMAVAELAMCNAVPFILNPAPARKLPPKLFKMIHTIVPNVHEAAVLTGREEPEEAARRLIARGCKNVVITLGAKGALVVTARQSINIPTWKVKLIDTVGAGDCFTGWLTVGIAEQMDVVSAARRAAVAASIAVSRCGAQDGMPYRKEVEDLYS
jgi:ribokinase